MKQMKMTGAIAALALAAMVWPAASQAAVVWTALGDGISWHDGNNWDTFTQPVTGDDVTIGTGKTVHITTAATMGKFTTGGTVEIDNGGSLTGSNSYTLRYITKININNGGLLVAGTSNWTIRSNTDINVGGTLTGTSAIGINDSRTLNVYGTFSPRGTTAAAAFQIGSSVSGSVNVGATGKVILDVFGNGDNESFNVLGMTAGTVLTLNTLGSQIELRTQGGYTPQAGDSFDLWNLADGSLATMNIGDGSNITLDGYTLDTSLWVSDGIVTVAAIVPEPASLALLALGGLAMIRRRR